MISRTSRTTLIICSVLALAALCYLPYQFSSHLALALDDGVARTPPMGWNSWNRFGCDVSEHLIQRMADAMVTSGMRDAGYQYVVVDDCWQIGRDAQGTILADPRRFPSGMAALVEYVHARGLKFGLYTDAGRLTCMGRPGSFGHEWQDAATYASWGVDYVKVDWCAADGLDAASQYAVFRDALAATGHPIVLSICTWGEQNPWDWGRGAGHLWRTTGDISDSWPVVLQIIRENAVRAYAATPGAWNDPDMLEVGNGRMNDAEYRSHFSLWAMMAAPLIAGNDLAEMTDSTRAILLNGEVIAIDQDPLGRPALIVRDDGGPQVWSRPLADPRARAVALFNPTGAPATITVHWNEIGLAPGDAAVRDLWAHADRGVVADSFTATVEPHGTTLLKITTPTVVALEVPAVDIPPPADAPAPPPVEAPQASDTAPSQTTTYPYLSDMSWTSASSFFGPVERDMSNGEAAAADGHPLTLGGQSYAKGLGVHAPADIRYDLGGNCTAFAADIGLDAEVGGHGTVSFQVWADGTLIYDSGMLAGGMAPTPVYLDITGVHELGLIVVPGGATTDYAHADWAGARVACND
jgi:alpha-galactosidase